MQLLFTKQQRQNYRQRLTQSRLRQLANVSTQPTQRATGTVLSLMLTSKPDPQRGEKIQLADYAAYLRPWWTTVNRVGLRGVVLHDGLPQQFIASATTDHVRFQQVTLGSWPLLHDRHRLVRDYLRQATDPHLGDQHVFVTDISDVAFKRDPFTLIEQDRGQHRIFVGSETKTIASCRCLRQEVTQQFGMLLHGDRQVVNPGILGGTRTEVLWLMERIVHCIAAQSQLVNSDMAIVNKVVHDNYSPGEIYTGPPLHSQFKRWEFDSPAAILHK